MAILGAILLVLGLLLGVSILVWVGAVLLVVGLVLLFVHPGGRYYY